MIPPERLLARFDDDDRYEAERIALALHKAVETAYSEVYDKYRDGSRNPRVRMILEAALACKTLANEAYSNAWIEYESAAGRV